MPLGAGLLRLVGFQCNMTIKNGIAYPDGTDQSANFRHQTVTGENGETLFFAPVRIRNDNDLKTFMVDKSARWTLPFGHSALKYKVLYFMTESEEMSEDFWIRINSEHSRENRLKRCLVPGKRRPLIPCPECNSCAKCPYPEYRDKHEMQEVVFDDEIKVQRTCNIKYMKTRWGSCNIPEKRILLNLQLVKKPVECLEYVITHELVHLLEKNHTNHFRALVEQYCPNWREARQLLNEMPLDYIADGEEE